MNPFDIIFFTFFIIVVILIVVINVINVINVVNMNSILNPNDSKPNITIKIQKDCNSDEYYVVDEKSKTQNNILNEQFHNSNEPKNQQTINSDNQNSKNNKQNSNPKNEQFGNVIDQEVNLTPAFTNFMPNTSVNVQYPDSNDIVNTVDNIISNNNIPELGSEEKPKMEETQKPTCFNKSLVDQRLKAYSYFFLNDNPAYNNQVNDIKFPICTRDEINGGDDLNDDLNERWRSQLTYVKSYLEDPQTRGSNLNSYDNYGNLSDIGNIPLNNTFKYPKPSGYIFESSVVYNR